MIGRKLALLLVIAALPATGHAQSFGPQTVWTNDHARLVVQSIDADGRLSGTYTNQGAGFGCAGRAFPVTGWVDGDKISFAVRRKDPANCTPIESWTGFMRDGELLVEFYAVVTDSGRTTILRGSDQYRRQ
ncbi:MAG: avidin/streptavidin family protein [Pseudomonadota bacterium]